MRRGSPTPGTIAHAFPGSYLLGDWGFGAGSPCVAKTSALNRKRRPFPHTKSLIPSHSLLLLQNVALHWGPGVFGPSALRECAGSLANGLYTPFFCGVTRPSSMG